MGELEEWKRADIKTGSQNGSLDARQENGYNEASTESKVDNAAANQVKGN